MPTNAVDLTDQRRGALLLVVLSMLIMFLMLGTVLVTHATRSRTAATSFATATASTNSKSVIARHLLDEALMHLIRGRTTPAAGEESILGDKYQGGAAIKGRASVMSANGPLIELTFVPTNAGDVGSYLDLNGRILTFFPTVSQGGTTGSYRILRAEPATGGAYTCFLANIRPQPAAIVPPATQETEVRINPYEFRTEPHDSFADDLWLTRFTLSGSAAPVVATVSGTAGRPAFTTSGTATVDNDGDGVADGAWRATVTPAWRDAVFPPRTFDDGRQLVIDVSYLVYDLDSRINVNAHGSPARLVAATGLPYQNSQWGSNAEVTAIDPGFGWGVADIDPSTVFPGDTNTFGRIVGGNNLPGRDYSPPLISPLRRRPQLPTLDGRCGNSIQPAPAASQAGQPNASASQYERAVYGTNNTVDLASMMKVFVDPGNPSATPPIPPTLQYRVPLGYAATFVDDPYEARLDIDAPRKNAYSGDTGALADTNDDNLFTVSELERVLRQFDADATSLPQRLAGLLGDQSQTARMLVTTDSWDTPVFTGTAATKVLNYFKTIATPPGSLLPEKLYQMLSPDVAAGLRFDVNRPFEHAVPADPTSKTTVESKQDYCRHLYCLLVALGANPNNDSAQYRRIAQWVVNIVDYRDIDSRFMEFTYDTDLSDGWGEGTNGWDPVTQKVYGNEKPELVIAQTLAWWKSNNGNIDPNNPTAGELFVTVYRPAVDMITDTNGTKTPITTLDLSLASASDPQKLDLAKKNDNGDPVWRLRYKAPGGSDYYVRFDANPNLASPYSSTNTSYPTTNQSAALLASDGFVCVHRNAVSPEGVTVGTSNTGQAIGLRVDGGADLMLRTGNSSDGPEVYLERLLDPELPFHTTSNPYVNLNSFPIKSVSRNGQGNSANWKTFRRCPSDFWKTPTQFDPNIENPPTLGSLDLGNRAIFPWPNRPFISQAELAMVPAGEPGKIFDDLISLGDSAYPYHCLSKSLASDELADALLDATFVPSRFVGAAVTVDQSTTPHLQKVGMERFPYRQISRYREPGRINVNTMPMTAYGNNGVARALLSGTTATAIFGTPSFTNPFLSTPAKNVGDLLNLVGRGTGSQGKGIFFDLSATTVNGNGGGNNDPCDGNGNGTTDPLAQEQLYQLLGLRTATRLANVATIRSNVFAIWITLKLTDTSAQQDTYHRLFAIVDRSIPTAYSPGEDLNARDTIRLKRFLE